MCAVINQSWLNHAWRQLAQWLSQPCNDSKLSFPKVRNPLSLMIIESTKPTACHWRYVYGISSSYNLNCSTSTEAILIIALVVAQPYNAMSKVHDQHMYVLAQCAPSRSGSQNGIMVYNPPQSQVSQNSKQVYFKLTSNFSLELHTDKQTDTTTTETHSVHAQWRVNHCARQSDSEKICGTMKSFCAVEYGKNWCFQLCWLGQFTHMSTMENALKYVDSETGDTKNINNVTTDHETKSPMHKMCCFEG